jgi:hypothetical protein
MSGFVSLEKDLGAPSFRSFIAKGWVIAKRDPLLPNPIRRATLRVTPHPFCRKKNGAPGY